MQAGGTVARLELPGIGENALRAADAQLPRDRGEIRFVRRLLGEQHDGPAGQGGCPPGADFRGRSGYRVLPHAGAQGAEKD